jgi:hypothetical protein
VDPAAPARRAAFRHARRKGTTRSNQKQELPTTGQTPKAHGIGHWPGFVRQAENMQAEQPVALQPGLPTITGEAKAAGLECA